jgi:hypothetical protein
MLTADIEKFYLGTPMDRYEYPVQHSSACQQWPCPH